MGSYDTEIRVSTKVDTSQMQKLQIQIDKAVDKVDALTKKYDELKNKKVPTQEYTNLERKLESAKDNLALLIAEEEKLSNAGLAIGAPWDNVIRKEADAQLKVEAIREEMQKLVETGKAFTIGSDREEINDTAKELARAKAELRMLVTKQDELEGKSYKVSDGLKKIGSAARNAFHSINQSAGRSFTTISNGARQSNSLLSAFAKRIKGLAASAFIFNLLSKGFNSMVSGMRTGFTNLMGYSNSFANSVQSVKNSLSTLGNQIAAAFMPIVQAVIPWLNQLISVIATAMSYVSQFIAALTGKSTYIRAKKVQDSFNSSLGGTSSKADKAADSMDDMADSAKKARGALAAFDDLDVLEKKDDTADRIKDINDAMDDLGGAGGGAGDLFEEVPIENSILDFVDKLKDIFAQLFAPLKKAWEQEGEFVIKAWKYALNEIWKLIKDIGRDFLTMWNQEATVRMLANILHIIGDIGLVVGNIVHALDEAWNKNDTGLHILENIRDIFAAIIQNIREAADYTVLWSEALDFSPLLESIEHLTSALVPFADFVSGTLADFYTEFLLPLASWSLSEDGIPRLINILGDFMDAVDWEALRSALKNLYAALEPYAEAIGEGLIDFIEELKDIGVNILNALPEPIQKLADALASGDPDKVREWTTALLELVVAIEGIKLVFNGFEAVEKGLTLLGFGGAAGGVSAAGEAMTGAAGGVSALSTAFGVLKTAVGYLVPILGGLVTTSMILDDSLNEMGEAAGGNEQQINTLSDRYDGLGGKLNAIKDAFSLVGNAMDGFGFNASNMAGQIGALETVMNNISDGMIYTDSQLEKLQARFGLTDDDIEMLRQSMLDTNEPLRQLADDFGLFDASVETLQMIQEGMKLVEDGTITAAEAFDEFSKPMWGMNDSALAFFQTLSESGMTIDEYKSSLENASEATQQFSNDMKEAGENISTGITEGFENADVETPTRGFFAKVVECLRSVFNMHSPAKNMEPFGENIFLGVVEGFRNSFSYFTDTITEWWENYVVPWFSAEKWAELGETVKMSLFETWTSIYETIVEKWTEIQEWFAEYWILFTESLFEIWENIILFFTETWEQIQLLFNNFIDFLNTVVLPIWQQSWLTAQNIFQIFRDFVMNIVNWIKVFFTEFFQKFVKNIIDVNWKDAWENAGKIFTTFKEKVDEIINTVREIIQSFFDWAMGLINSILSKISEVGSAISGIFGGGGGGDSGGGGGVSFAMARAASYIPEGIPALASGAVIRGGNPFMAVLGDQPKGVTNIETPLPTMVDAFKQAIAETGGIGGSERVPVNINLNYDGETFARLSISDILSELDRQGYNVDVLGVT